MDDFFEQFKDNLENRQEPKYEDRLWQRLGKDLDKENEKPRGGLAWWWPVAGLLFSSFAMNCFFFWKTYNTYPPKTTNTTTVEIQKDTVFNSSVVYIRDTIYQSQKIYEKIIEYIPVYTNSVAALGQPPKSLFNFSDNRGTNIKYSMTTPFKKYAAQNPAKANTMLLPDKEQSAPVGDLDFLEKLKLRALDYPDGELSFLTLELHTKKRRKTLLQHAYAMRPRGVRIGLLGGWVYPISKKFKGEIGNTLGVEITIEYLQNFQLWVNAAWLNYNFEATKMDESIGAFAFDPLQDNLRFSLADVNQDALQYAGGLTYLFNGQKKWRPSIGVGYGVNSFLPYDIFYEFRDEFDAKWSFEKRIAHRQSVKGFLLLRLGVDYEFSEHLFGNIRATYRTNASNATFKAPQLFTTQFGLNYRF